jgi:phosphoglycolate phosphatase
MSKKVIIFDMDGVLVDTIDFIYERFFKAIWPLITREDFEEANSFNISEAKDRIKYPQIVETDEEKKLRIEKYAEDKAKLPLFNGVKELLERLHKQGFILVLNTSAVNKNCLPMLENLKIIHLFDFIGSAEISKSKVEKFKIISEKYNIAEENMLFVTDAIGDIKEAEEVGVSTIAVTWGAQKRKFFEESRFKNLVAIVDTIEELDEFIEKF